MEIIKSVPKNIQLSKDLSTRFPGAQSASFNSEFPWGLLKVASYSSMVFNLSKCRWQMPCCSVIGTALGKCQSVVDNGNFILSFA